MGEVKEGKEPKRGDLSRKVGGTCAWFWLQIWGDRSNCI